MTCKRFELLVVCVSFAVSLAALYFSLAPLPKPSVLPHPDPAGVRLIRQTTASASALPAWAPGCQVHPIAESPDQFNVFTVAQSSVCYFNAVTPPGLGPKPDTWTTCDVSGYVPAGAVAVELAGVLIITHGQTPETADLEMFFRRDETVTSGLNYNLQAICAFVGDGQRCCASTWVPLTAARTFQWKWSAAAYPTGTLPTYGYPTTSAYGANLRVVAYAAPN